jgi:hypothetical protein
MPKTMPDQSDDQFVDAWLDSLPREAWNSLTDPLLTIERVYELELQWQNGGFHQYFHNPSGNHWRETLAALERLEASRILKLFKAALAVFPGSAPSTDHFTRADQLDAAGAEAIEILNRLDDKYMALYKKWPEEDSYARMAQFLRRHVEESTAD